MLKKIGIDNFIIALGIAVLIAKLYPAAGLDYEPVSLGDITNIGVAFIFFFYGLKLNFEQIKKGLKNWKLHLHIHFTSFILFPILILISKKLFVDTDLYTLWLGCFFLAALPSTVSSSVVMVNIAKGNIPAAIFNASISSLLGIFITPIWMSFEMGNISQELDMTNVMLKLVVQVLIPVILGLMLNKYWGAWAATHKEKLKYFDQFIIVLIVYAAFAKSFDQDLFAQQSASVIWILSALMLLLFVIVFYIVKAVCVFLKFNREDTITAVFCGSKKSLVHGSVMAAVLFGASTQAGIILLPIMIYHALQLIITSWMANKWSSNQNAQ